MSEYLRARLEASGDFMAVDWGLKLKAADIQSKAASYIGIKAYHIEEEAGQTCNTLQCEIASHMKNPRGVSVYLRSKGATDSTKTLEWEISYEQWAAIQKKNTKEAAIYLPPQALFLME